jgi:signal transduction histidine kinase
MASATTDDEKMELLDRLGQLIECDHDISWTAAIQSALLDFKLKDMILLGKFFLHGLAPSRVTSAFNLTPVEAASLLLQKSLDWRDFVDPRDHEFVGNRRELMQRVLTSNPEDIFENKDEYSGKYLQLITQKMVDSRNAQIQVKWFRALIGDGNLRSREIELLVDSYAKRREKLPEELAEVVWEVVQNKPTYGDYVILNLYQYAKQAADYDLGDRLFELLLESPNTYSQVAIHSTVFYALEENRNEILKLGVENVEFLKRIDFTTFDAIGARESAKSWATTLRKAIRKSAMRFPEDSDFMILLNSYLFIAETISPKKVVEISDAARQYFEGPKAREYSSQSKALAESELLLRTQIFHPEIYGEISSVIKKIFPKRAHMIQRIGAVLSDSESSQIDVLNTAFEQGFYSLSGHSLAILAITSSPDLLPKLNAACKILDFSLSKNLKIPDVVIERLFKYIAYELDFEESRKVFEGLLSIETLTLKSVLLNRIAFELLVDNRRRNSALALVRSLESFGIPVRNNVRELALNVSVTSGEHYDWGLVDGPEAEYWSQLAVIFDDVVHELNQPLLALSNWIEYLKLLDTGAPGERAKGIAGLENAKNELASRMIHYQALTTGGTDPMWYQADVLVEQVLKDLANQLAGSHVEVRLETNYLKEGKWIFAPGFQFRLAIRNIVRNAISALETVQREREIRISVKNPFQSSSQIIVVIEDNGPGIPEELQENIFEKGFTTKEGRGLGLGLPLAATVVRGMGGTLKLQETSEMGSTFVIVLHSSASPVVDWLRGNELNRGSRPYDGEEDSDEPDELDELTIGEQ